jgi:hypothetical protein
MRVVFNKLEEVSKVPSWAITAGDIRGRSALGQPDDRKRKFFRNPDTGIVTYVSFIDIDIDIFVNCNWVETRWQ